MKMILGEEPKGINKLVDSICLFLVDKTGRNLKFKFKGIVREYINKNDKRNKEMDTYIKDNKFDIASLNKTIRLRELLNKK